MRKELVQLLQENAFIPVYAIVLVLSIYRYRYYSKLKAFPILPPYILLTEIFGLLVSDIDKI
ncbi:MAG: hypothetical protein ACJAWH_002269 [Maribacter sp.]|jgi:hypothetical protein